MRIFVHPSTGRLDTYQEQLSRLEEDFNFLSPVIKRIKVEDEGLFVNIPILSKLLGCFPLSEYGIDSVVYRDPELKN